MLIVKDYWSVEIACFDVEFLDIFLCIDVGHNTVPIPIIQDDMDIIGPGH